MNEFGIDFRIMDVIRNVILDLGIHARKGETYEIIIPALTQTLLVVPADVQRELHMNFIWPRDTKDISNKPDSWKIAKVVEFAGNKFIILGDFYTFKGDRHSLRDIYDHYDKYGHDGFSFHTNSHKIGFSYHYRKIKKRRIDEKDLSN